MLVIVGESASGKSTLQKMLIEAHPEYEKIVTYTTRPARESEIDGADYHFVSEEVFEELRQKGHFIEHTNYRGWNYGTALEDCKKNNAVAVLNPPGLRAIKRKGINVTSVYLSVDRRSRLINLLARGDNIEEAYRRNLSDEGQFSGIIDEVDYVIVNYGFEMSEEQVLKCLEEILKEVKP